MNAKNNIENIRYALLKLFYAYRRRSRIAKGYSEVEYDKTQVTQEQLKKVVEQAGYAVTA